MPQLLPSFGCDIALGIFLIVKCLHEENDVKRRTLLEQIEIIQFKTRQSDSLINATNNFDSGRIFALITWKDIGQTEQTTHTSTNRRTGHNTSITVYYNNSPDIGQTNQTIITNRKTEPILCLPQDITRTISSVT